jgi:hypothetical protein
VVAATFTVVVPGDAMAQLSMAASSAQSTVAAPFVQIVSYISYVIGTVMVVAGIAQAKKHADNPGQTPLGPALGRLGAGAAFLAAPFVAGTVMQTGSGTFGGTVTFQEIGGI